MTVIKMDCTFCEFDFKFWTDVKIVLFTIEISHYRGLRPTFPHTDFSVFFKFLSSQSFVKSIQLWDLINIISLTCLDSWSNESSWQNLAEKIANFAGCRLLHTTLGLLTGDMSDVMYHNNFQIFHLSGLLIKLYSYFSVPSYNSQELKNQNLLWKSWVQFQDVYLALLVIQKSSWTQTKDFRRPF